MSDKQTGVSAAAASQESRSASVGAFPPPTLRSITEAVAALSQLPSFQTYAAARIQPNVAMMQTAGLAAKLGARYEVPAISRVAVDLAPLLSGIDIMKAAGIASSLDAGLGHVPATARDVRRHQRRWPEPTQRGVRSPSCADPVVAAVDWSAGRQFRP